MTIEELERELATLAAPQEEDPRLRAAIRARLGEQVLLRDRRSLRPVFRPGWAAAVAAAATAATAVVSLGWPGGSAGPSTADAAIIRHAVQALTSPANEIVHVKETGVEDGIRVSAEWWQQTGPSHALRMVKGPVGRQTEAADDGTTAFQYDAGTNTILERPDGSAPSLVDPIAGVREQLAHGRAHVAGTAMINGTRTYKINLSSGVVAYLDAANYRPLYLDNPQRDGGIVRTRVLIYEELPMTPENAKLLELAGQHPDARVETTAKGTPVK